MANLNETIGRLARPLTSLISLGADKGYLSLDIGSSSIKMVEVHRQGSTLKITNAGIIPLHSDAVQSHCVQDIGRALSVTSEQLLDEIQRSLSFFWTAATEETGLDTSSKLAPALGQMGALFGRLSRGGAWSKSTRPTFQENVGPGSGHYNLPLRTSPLWVAEPTRTGRKAVS